MPDLADLSATARGLRRRDTPNRAATSVTPNPRERTSKTARYRCSTTGTSTSASPGPPSHDAPANVE